MKKTEEELKEEIMEEYGFEEDDERVDKVLEVKKDRYTATQAKKKAQEEAENYKKGKDFYKSKSDPKGEKGEKPREAKEATLSVKDSARLQQANIPVDDWDDVIDYAKFKNIPITDALQSSIVKSTLAGKAEERKTAEATNTKKGNKRSSGKARGSDLLDKAVQSNELPESDGDIDTLIDTRLERKANRED